MLWTLWNKISWKKLYFSDIGKSYELKARILTWFTWIMETCFPKFLTIQLLRAFILKKITRGNSLSKTKIFCFSALSFANCQSLWAPEVNILSKWFYKDKVTKLCYYINLSKHIYLSTSNVGMSRFFRSKVCI